MLSEQDRAVLAAIERGLAADYPDLPRSMARQRRRINSTWALLLILAAAWIAGTVVAVLSRSWANAVVLVTLATITAIAVGVRRRRERKRRVR